MCICLQAYASARGQLFETRQLVLLGRPVSRWAITSRRRRRHRRPCCRLLAGWRGSPGPRYRSFSPSRVPVSGPVVYSERRRGGRRGAAAPLLNLVNLFLPQMIRSQDWQESLRELPRSHSIVYRVTAQPYHKCPVPVG